MITRSITRPRTIRRSSRQQSSVTPGIIGRWVTWTRHAAIDEIGEVVADQVGYNGTWYLLVQDPDGLLRSQTAEGARVVTGPERARLVASYHRRRRRATARKRGTR